MRPLHTPDNEIQHQEKTVIYFIRHADVHNPGDVLYGRLPRFGLSNLGREQAARTADALADAPISVFYTSPMLRARQTVRAIASCHPGVPVRTSELLNEVLTGWQGRPHSDLEEIGFDFYNNPLGPDDESLEGLWKRIQRFVYVQRRRHPGAGIAGVSHGDCVFLARAIYNGEPLDLRSLRHPYVYPGKGSITRLTFSPDLKETYPLRVEYFDPNSEGEPWSNGYVTLESGKGLTVSEA